MKNITKIITLLLFVLFVGVFSSEFQTFKAKNAKNYASVVEETKRKAIFTSNLKKVQILNDEEKKSNGSATFGITIFSDLEPDEFIAKYTGFKKDKRIRRDAVVLDGDSISVAAVKASKADTNVFGEKIGFLYI